MAITNFDKLTTPSNSFKQAAEACRRSLNFLSSGTACDSKCWPILVDFLHASQWQSTDVRKSTYTSMLVLGMPSNRTLVRRLIPLEIQEYYNQHCYSALNGLEYYVLDCPKGIAEELSSQTVENIAAQLAITLIDVELKHRQ